MAVVGTAPPGYSLRAAIHAEQSGFYIGSYHYAGIGHWANTAIFSLNRSFYSRLRIETEPRPEGAVNFVLVLFVEFLPLQRKSPPVFFLK